MLKPLTRPRGSTERFYGFLFNLICVNWKPKCVHFEKNGEQRKSLRDWRVRFNGFHCSRSSFPSPLLLVVSETTHLHFGCWINNDQPRPPTDNHPTSVEGWQGGGHAHCLNGEVERIGAGDLMDDSSLVLHLTTFFCFSHPPRRAFIAAALPFIKHWTTRRRSFENRRQKLEIPCSFRRSQTFIDCTVGPEHFKFSMLPTLQQE